MSEQPQSNDIIFYNTPAGDVKIEVIFNDETFWLTQKRLAALFGVEVPAISKHLRNIFESKELQENAVVSKMETTASDGKKYLTSFYNLDAIIAVGYRVNSFQATQFRIWATKTLREYIIKGFVTIQSLTVMQVARVHCPQCCRRIFTPVWDRIGDFEFNRTEMFMARQQLALP